MNPCEIPKTLLVTFTPPGDRNVGEIILRDLCALLPEDKVCVFAAHDADAPHFPYPVKNYAPPRSDAWRPLPGYAGGLCNYLQVRSRFNKGVQKLIKAAVDFGRNHRVQQVWLVLNSPPLVATGAAIADELNIPLRTLVWDPPGWAAQKCGWDRASRTWLLQRFDQSLRASKRVMVVSDGMVDAYREKHDANCAIVRHALQQDPAPVAGLPDDQEAPILIGFAGTLYDNNQLNVLLTALHQLDWKINGHPVHLRMIGNYYRFNGLNHPCRIELCGWRSTEETHRLLQTCHIQYLPITFQKNWKDFARLSFPTKWSTYLATGRPVLVHAPEYSSSVAFAHESQCGEVCASLHAEDMADSLLQLLDNAEAYAEKCRAVQETCKTYFSYAVMKKSFAQFLEIEASLLN